MGSGANSIQGFNENWKHRAKSLVKTNCESALYSRLIEINQKTTVLGTTQDKSCRNSCCSSSRDRYCMITMVEVGIGIEVGRDENQM